MRKPQRGQAAVEAALTLPLTVFLFLAILQMFLLAQGRVLGQVAAYRATRVGSTNHGNCGRMTHAAILSVIPAITSFLGGPGTMPAERLAEAFRKHRFNRYDDVVSDGGKAVRYSGAIVWIAREQPRALDVQALGAQDSDFDQPGKLMRLETRLIFWFPMKIPFANWVLSRIWLAHYGLKQSHPGHPVGENLSIVGQQFEGSAIRCQTPERTPGAAGPP